jgi:hypothetical protein
MYANLVLDLEAAKYLIEKSFKVLRKRQIVEDVLTEESMNKSRACSMLIISQSPFAYKSIKDDSFCSNYYLSYQSLSPMKVLGYTMTDCA